VRRIAEELDRLEVRVAQRLSGRAAIDDEQEPVRFEDTRRLAQPSFEAGPVMGAEPGRGDVERAVGERQPLDARLLRARPPPQPRSISSAAAAPSSCAAIQSRSAPAAWTALVT